eukprot:1150664-Pelagomonas_calceolata.AAC.1
MATQRMLLDMCPRAAATHCDGACIGCIPLHNAQLLPFHIYLQASTLSSYLMLNWHRSSVKATLSPMHSCCLSTSVYKHLLCLPTLCATGTGHQ